MFPVKGKPILYWRSEKIIENDGRWSLILPTIVVITLNVLRGFIQPILIQLLLGQLMPESNIQGTAKGGKL